MFKHVPSHSAKSCDKWRLWVPDLWIACGSTVFGENLCNFSTSISLKKHWLHWIARQMRTVCKLFFSAFFPQLFSVFLDLNKFLQTYVLCDAHTNADRQSSWKLLNRRPHPRHRFRSKPGQKNKTWDLLVTQTRCSVIFMQWPSFGWVGFIGPR